MLGKLAWEAFSLSYGLFNYTLLVAFATLRDGVLFKRPSREEAKQLSIAQQRYWDLSNSPFPGFKHAFQTLRNGTKLHYVVRDTPSGKGKNVAIFIHGFPDSFGLWKSILGNPALADYILIAVDLPGYGGSDSLPGYSPNEVLETMTGFILAMREKHVQQGARLVMVTHDWGAIVGTRLAAEAKELADRWIITSAVIPAQVKSNVTTRLASSQQMLRTYLSNPLNTRLLKAAYATSQPIVSQLRRSFYIFVFLTPRPLTRWFMRMGDFWATRNVHKVAFGVKLSQPMTPAQSAEAMAITGGPGAEQFSTQTGPEDGGQTYSASVRARANDFGMFEKTRLYREKLGLGVWEKSIETVVALSEIQSSSSSSTGAGIFEDGPQGALKAPATIVQGKYDTAFEHRLGLDGIGDYLTRGSQAIVLDRTAHWIPHAGFGARVLGDIVAWAMEGEKVAFRERFGGEGEVQFVVDK
ncbi:alpha/beta-hydrolase [Aaosphaeria arxii CBS 175.79]|uniref:Alpha/beta-hydrolase n=1 Tax=Aaosphaeria arxii CBS 175.79 TaxID=1450172 RepID=A0A6A5Y5Q3_9PLEO|nr:alpha/beta-hydrolase [Aaosphaeria arxii CBS 175.79]KAF2020616.1 alpha/beta-hydrolase [Aaosphaeria arxii CBS 175.79]